MMSKRRDTWQLDNAPVLRRKIASDLNAGFIGAFGVEPTAMTWAEAWEYAQHAHPSQHGSVNLQTLLKAQYAGARVLRTPVGDMPLLWIAADMCDLAQSILLDPTSPTATLSDAIAVLEDQTFRKGLALFQKPLDGEVFAGASLANAPQAQAAHAIYALVWETIIDTNGDLGMCLQGYTHIDGHYAPTAWTVNLISQDTPDPWINAWVAVLLLMSTPTVAEPRHIDVRTGGAPKAGRPRPDLMVTAIQLRPLRALDHDQETDSTGRAYTCRWLVRPHLRRLRDGRVVAIPGHIKGPAWAPIKVKESVRVWRR